MDDPGSLVPDVGPPLLVDIDGTLTDADRAVDPRVFPVLRQWPAPVVVATGKAMPYPIALCEFLAIEHTVVAENGGVVFVGETDTVHVEGDREAAQAVADEYRRRGYSLGWDEGDLVNRWRETEIAVHRGSPLSPLESIAAEYGLEVVDTGFAYHVKSPDVDKGTGLERIASGLGAEPSDFVAVGDSENDAAAFELVGRAVAVANADDSARAAADCVTSAAYADGFLEAIDWLVAST